MIVKQILAAWLKEHGYDVKFAYHVVRLLNEVEQILEHGDMDLMLNNEQLKSIRRGDWKIEDIEGYFKDKERGLEILYNKSKLPHKPREKEIKQLLLNCLEEHYGSLDGLIQRPDQYHQMVADIRKIVER